jgi:hypothetical protein
MSKIITTKEKRKVVIAAFGNIPHLEERHYSDFLYARRHSKSLAKEISKIVKPSRKGFVIGGASIR